MSNSELRYQLLCQLSQTIHQLNILIPGETDENILRLSKMLGTSDPKTTTVAVVKPKELPPKAPVQKSASDVVDEILIEARKGSFLPQNVLAQAKQFFPHRNFTVYDLEKKTGVTRHRLKMILGELFRSGEVKRDETTSPKVYHF